MLKLKKDYLVYLISGQVDIKYGQELNLSKINGSKNISQKVKSCK